MEPLASYPIFGFPAGGPYRTVDVWTGAVQLRDKLEGLAEFDSKRGRYLYKLSWRVRFAPNVYRPEFVIGEGHTVPTELISSYPVQGGIGFWRYPAYHLLAHQFVVDPLLIVPGPSPAGNYGHRPGAVSAVTGEVVEQVEDVLVGGAGPRDRVLSSS